MVMAPPEEGSSGTAPALEKATGSQGFAAKLPVMLHCD